MDLLGTDMTKVAAAYAAFAGVLAGFVFAVMGYLLGSHKLEVNREGGSNIEIALSWSVLAFIGLSIAAFLFALLSGEDRFSLPINNAIVGPTRIRPLALDIVASAVLSTAILVLLLSLNWLFYREKVSRALIFQLRLVEWAVGLLTLFYVYGAIWAVPIAQNRIASDDPGPSWAVIVIFALAVISGEIVGRWLHLTKSNPGQLAHAIRRFLLPMTQFLLLVLFVACAIIFNFIDFATDADANKWDVTVYLWWGLGALGFILFLCVLNLPGWQNEKKPGTHISNNPATSKRSAAASSTDK